MTNYNTRFSNNVLIAIFLAKYGRYLLEKLP